MSFLGRLFGRTEPDEIEYLKAMLEMVSEAERTYRGMLNTYNSDVADGILPGTAISPTGPCLYRARLYGALFMVAAFTKVARPEDAMEFMNAATGLRRNLITGHGSEG